MYIIVLKLSNYEKKNILTLLLNKKKTIKYIFRFYRWVKKSFYFHQNTSTELPNIKEHEPKKHKTLWRPDGEQILCMRQYYALGHKIENSQ